MSTVPRSPDYQRFLDSFDITDRESMTSLDLGALSALDTSERALAEAELVEHLEQQNDPRAADGLALLRTPSAIAALKRRMKRPYPDTALFFSARAVWVIDRDPAALEAMLSSLRHGTRTTRIMAACELEVIPGEAVDEGLLDGMGADADSAVRTTAWLGMIKRYDLGTLLEAQRGNLRRLGYQVDLPIAVVRTEAVRELRRIYAELRSGRTPAEVGLIAGSADSADYLAVQQSVSAGAAPVDVEAFRRLHGEERAWGEYLLLWLLGKNDRRGAAAIAALGIESAAPALREIVAAQGPIAGEALDALRSLGMAP